MAASLAIAAAVIIGVADFMGGFATRGAPAAVVAFWVELLGLALMLPIAFGAGTSDLTLGAAAWGVGAGLTVGVGLPLFYAAMAGGLVSLAAPTAAVVGAVLPIVYGFARGERPGPVAVAGIGLALAAILIVSLAPSHPDHAARAGAGRSIALALAAGLCFGGFFVFFSRAGHDSAVWSGTFLRVGSASLLAALALRLRPTRRPSRRLAWMVAVIAVLEVTATLALAFAYRHGSVAVVSVLSSLYPVTTVLLASAVLRERMTRVQLVAVALALVAVALVSTG